VLLNTNHSNFIHISDYQRKFFLQSPHCAEFPDEGGFPVLRERLHCLQRRVPQLLQGQELEDPHPDEYLHIGFYC